VPVLCTPTVLIKCPPKVGVLKPGLLSLTGGMASYGQVHRAVTLWSGEGTVIALP
jgi:hypothetical protein